MVASLLALSLFAQAGPCSVQGTLVLELPSGERTSPTDAVVYLKDGPARASAEPRTHVISQKNFKFSPALLVVQVNDRVDFVNEDPTVQHSVFSKQGIDPFVGAKNGYKTTFSRTFAKEGSVHVQCDIHGEMQTDILVLSSGAFARPDAKGRWKLSGLERKAYTLVVWEPNGAMQTVEIAACATKPFQLELVKNPPWPKRHNDGTPYAIDYQPDIY